MSEINWKLAVVSPRVLRPVRYWQDMPKVDDKLNNIISYRIIINRVIHKVTDSDNRCLLIAEGFDFLSKFSKRKFL